MVDIVPFRALRLTAKKKGEDISKFICPPYDVISPREKVALIKKSPVNVVRLELPDGEGDKKYGNAAQTLLAWRAQGLLQDDRCPSFYLLGTTYRISDSFAPQGALKRYGVLVGLRSEPPGKGAVRPHEKTLSKAKEDRLKLLSMVRTNISPIFGLFFDKKSAWPAWVAKVIKGAPLVRGKEKAGLDHRLWKVENPALVKSLKTMLKKKDLYIADGHHRYEVSWAYKESRLQTEPQAGPREGFHHVMTYICPMEERGLLMLPTHRLVKSSLGFEAWEKHLSTLFNLHQVKSIREIINVLADKSPEDRVLGWVHAKGMYLLHLKKELSLDRCLSHRPAALRALDVVLLHDLALDEAPQGRVIKEKEIEYSRNLEEIVNRPKKDSSWVSFLLGSPGVASLAKVAAAGEVMPPKTTYFYPKVPTGFTLMPLDQSMES